MAVRYTAFAALVIRCLCIFIEILFIVMVTVVPWAFTGLLGLVRMLAVLAMTCFCCAPHVLLLMAFVLSM